MITQYGALPYRQDTDRGLQILLVTSRNTGRWVIPKGNPMLWRSGWETAAREAYEEAGVKGEVARVRIGSFRYRKRPRLLRLTVRAKVLVYPMRVEAVLDRWPEAHQRRRQWFGRTDAAAAVSERELKRLILAFEP